MTQELALNLLKSGLNIFLTGSAGTGKTYVLNQFIKHLKHHKISVAVTASTGIAATHMDGQTIHSFSGIGIKSELSTKDLRNIGINQKLVKRLEQTKVLIIDEVSMLHKKQLDAVNKVLKHFKQNNAPFGGVQVVLCGDFFQLPPVADSQEEAKDKFCFMSAAWQEAKFSICYLSKQYRQKENELSTILNEIRSGHITTNSIQLLKNCVGRTVDKTATKLFTHNVDVDSLNLQYFTALPNKPTLFKGKSKGAKKQKEFLLKATPVAEELALKLDTKVMFVKNNPERGYVNGTTGRVVDFYKEDSNTYPIVETFSGKRIIVKNEIWLREDDKGKELASFQQIPLRYAWAITIHKSQGMTLDAAEIDLNNTFEAGQGYVALSRVSSLQGLSLTGFNEQSLRIDSLAFKADQRFKALSAEAEAQAKDADFETAILQNIIHKDGVLKPTTEVLKETKAKGASKSKQATEEVSFQMFEQGATLEEIAMQRNYKVGTIAQHLIDYKLKNPKANFDSIRVNEALVTRLNDAYEILAKKATPPLAESGKIALKPLFEALNGEATYDEIRIGLLKCSFWADLAKKSASLRKSKGLD